MSPLISGVKRAHTLRRFAPVVDAAEPRLLLTTFLVTNTSDSGAGSLRQAILDSNSSTTSSIIDFSIGTGPQTIIPSSPLPTISNPVTIDGTTQPGYAGTPIIQLNGSQIFYPGTIPPNTYPIPSVPGLNISAGGTTIRGLAINRFTGAGISITSGGNNRIVGNFLGTDLTGTIALANGGDGVSILSSRNNVIGGSAASDRNVLSGNQGSGVAIYTTFGQSNASGNIIQGNLIGTDANSSLNLGNNGDGVYTSGSSTVVGGLNPGAGNVIAYSSGNGVRIDSNYYSTTLAAASILSNSIYGSLGQGIAYTGGATNPINSPALNSAFQSGSSTSVEGSFFGLPTTTYSVQFFSNPTSDPHNLGQGRTLLATLPVSTDDDGQARFTVSLPTQVALGQYITATATTPGNATSTFFPQVQVARTATANLVVTQTTNSPGVSAGNPLTYTVTTLNNGPSTATGVVVTSTLSQGVVISSVSAPGATVTRSNGVITFAYDTVYSGSSVTAQITVVPGLAGTITNTVKAVANQVNPDPSTSTSQLDTNVVSSTVPPTVVGRRLIVGLSSINSIVLTFSQALDPLQAQNPINYRLILTSPHSIVKLNAPKYNPGALTVTLTPVKPLRLGKIYRLQINGVDSAGVTNLAGNLLVGNTASGASGPYIFQFSRGVVPPHQAAPHRSARRPRVSGVRIIETTTTRKIQSGPASAFTQGRLRQT